MPQNYRQQNESGRWQDYSRSGQRGGMGRERYETGNERRFRPDWDDRYYDWSNQDESFEGDRSYSASGYPEEFGYRREHGESERGGYQRHGSQEGRDERFGGRYYERPYSQGQGRGSDYLARDFGRGGALRSQGQRYDFERDEGSRGEDFFNRGRGEQYGSGLYGGGSRNYYGAQGGFGTGSGGTFGREFGSERQMQQQSYRGRGPKGYERSDERLREMICERLTDDPWIDASEVSVDVNNKVVKLSGTVSDRRMKYLVEDVVEQIGGVRDIDNQLRVQPGSQAQASQYGASESGAGGRNINVGQSSSIGQPGGASQPGMPPSKRN